jgi:regulator of protease activity HflC (stomatin/prohibitin superfamily)
MEALIKAIWATIIEFWPWTIVEEWERGIRLRKGKYHRTLYPGIRVAWPFIDSIHTVNVKPQPVNIPAQNNRTQDGIEVVTKGALVYEIVVPRRIWLNVQDHDEILIETCQGLIATTLEDYDLSEITPSILVEAISDELNEVAEELGLKIIRFTISDFARSRPNRLMVDGDLGLA